MKKILSFILPILAISLFISCEKENGNPVTQFSVTIEDDNDAKTYIDATDNHLKWREGDQIKVFGSSTPNESGIFTADIDQSNARKADFNYTSGTAPRNYSSEIYYAFYPSSIAPSSIATASNASNTISIPSTQNNLHEFPMYAQSSQGSNVLKFKNICGLIKLNLTKPGVSVTSITLTFGPNDIVNGEFTVKERNSTSLTVDEVTGSTSGRNVITMQLGDNGVDISNATDFYFYVPVKGNNTTNNYKAFTNLSITINGKSGNKNYVCSKQMNGGTLRVYRGQYSTITLDANNLFFFSQDIDPYNSVSGTLPGVFTVSASGKKVYFSQGNLQFIGSATNPYWRFATNQWDVMTNFPEQKVTTNNDNYMSYDRDYFGFGTSNLTETESSNIYRPWRSGKPNKNITLANNLDWGANSITNGGNQGGIWYTLTSAEWTYLISNTRGGSGHGQANVHGKNGLIIFPDDYDCTIVSIGWTNESTWPVISNDDWATLAAAGCVFLPANGYFSSATDAEPDNINKQVSYSSSTNNGTGATYNALWGHGSSIGIYTATPAASRGGVRLVRSANGL